MKNVGWGTLSPLFVLVGLILSISVGTHEAYGDKIIRMLGLDAWSNGDDGVHYTLYYLFIFYIPALILGLKFKEHFGATLGKNLSLCIVAILSVTILLVVI